MDEHIREIFDNIKQAVPSLQVDNADSNVARVPELHLSLTVRIRSLDSDPKGASAVIYYWLYHPSFDESLFETTATLGENAQKAVHNGVVSFQAGLFSAVLDYLAGEEDECFDTEFFGQNKKWRLVKSDLVMTGKSSPAECYWPLLAEQVRGRLGNKVFYYIKVFVAKQADDTLSLECRVNDALSKSLSQTLEHYATNIQSTGFCSQKQFFLIGRQSPFEPYQFTRQEVEDFTDRAVMLFSKCGNYEEYEAIIDKLTKITNDRCLAGELHSFLPEMCAANYYGSLDFSEEIVLLRGGKRIPVYKDAFTSYNWINRHLIKGFLEKRYPVETYGKLITLSSAYSVIKQVEKEKGREALKGFRLSTVMPVPEDYVVR